MAPSHRRMDLIDRKKKNAPRDGLRQARRMFGRGACVLFFFTFYTQLFLTRFVYPSLRHDLQVTLEANEPRPAKVSGKTCQR